jgi:hypothetical protein
MIIPSEFTFQQKTRGRGGADFEQRISSILEELKNGPLFLTRSERLAVTKYRKSKDLPRILFSKQGDGNYAAWIEGTPTSR